MKIMNPATGGVIAEVAADNLKTVRAKYELARAAQPKWAAVPIKKRLAVLARFRELLIERQDLLAKTLTAEVGKPIRQSRNELNGLTARIDFFLAETERALRDERVFADAKGTLEERIAHEPLGVIANISAWNYPYFVGGNVFVPALAAGNAVLYKPSEFATLTGQHIADLLHEAGVPRNVFIAVIGDGATGAALLRQPVDGVFFTGSYGTGAKIAASTGRRMIKTSNWAARIRSTSARTWTSRPQRQAWPTARSTTPGNRAARWSASTSTSRSTTPSWPRSSQK
jgi:acyl-CoA reductase-like NAD-dependent aldehyde dehydrogenase